MAAGQDDLTYRELLYVRRRFITRESLREAIAQVVNATLRVRHPGIWNDGTTACAADSKQFGAWDQNLMTESSISVQCRSTPSIMAATSEEDGVWSCE
jgi:TnpA family transposase